MRYSLLTIALCSILSVHAQFNLVPNYSFEVINLCPTGISGFSYTADTYVDEWLSGTGGGSSDYFNACAGVGSWVNVPDNLFATDQPAHTGDAYGGFWTDLYDNNTFTYREYVQVQLTEPLVAGACYYVEFWSAPATQSDFFGSNHATTDAIGAYFSDIKVGDPFTSGVLPVTPQIDNNGTGNYISTPGDWTKICGYFEAEGGEEWICIGNFHPDDEVEVVAYEGGILDATPLVYLFVDDVLVTPLDSMFNIPDTVVCSPFVVEGPSCVDAYLWNTGATTSDITITEAGDYWLQITTSCGVRTDTFHVTFVTDSLYTSATDLINCYNAFPLDLEGDPAYDYYVWSTGETTANISVDGPGIYYLNGFSECAQFIDTFVVDIIEALPEPELGPDTTICADSWSMELHAPPGYISYTWNTGETMQDIEVNTPGTYTVSVHSTCDDFTDNIIISEDPNLHAEIDLGPDVYLCPPAGLNVQVLDAGITLPNYHWNTGETSATILVTEPGTYFVYADLPCSTPADTIEVLLCEDIGVPNAFSPNNDGVNDFASVIVVDPARIYFFRIYDRWGNLVFDGDASHYSWDGKYNNEPQPMGSYVYILQYDADGTVAIKQGNITLVR